MKFMQLKYVLEVDRVGSIKQAAQSLNVNQPYLSRTIHALEEEIETQLFERTSKGVEPTLKGRLFLDKARQVINELDDLQMLFYQYPTSIRLQVALPRASYLAKAYTDLLAHIDFNKTALDFNYLETSSDEVIKLILESQFDLGVVRYSALQEKQYCQLLNDKNLKSQKLCVFQAQILMSRHHPLAGKPIINLDDLKNYTQLYHGDNDFFLSPHNYDNTMENHRFSKRILIYERASQLEMLSTLTDTFMWVSPMPQSILDRYGLITRKAANICVQYTDLLIYRDNYTLTKYDHLFIELVNKNINLF